MIPLIVPAILTDKLENFKQDLEKIGPHFSSIQIDVVDGIFLPNKTFSEREELENINSEAYFELHLMVKNPIDEITKWRGIDSVTSVIFHIEAAANPEKSIQIIKETGWKAGLALSPETDIEKVLPYVDMVDEILFMTVHPGQQGAPFVEEVLEKIKKFKNLNLGVLISADGGINKHTIKSVVDAGAEKLYIGSAITRADDAEKAHEELIKQL